MKKCQELLFNVWSSRLNCAFLRWLNNEVEKYYIMITKDKINEILKNHSNNKY